MIRKLLGTALCVIAVWALISTTAGCGKHPRNKVVPVKGKLTFANGTPLPAGTRLQFNPASGRMGSATGVTDKDGSFVIKHTYGGSGAEVGKYAVLLQAPENDSGAFYKAIPKEYYDGGALSVEVTEGMPALSLVVKKS